MLEFDDREVLLEQADGISRPALAGYEPGIGEVSRPPERVTADQGAKVLSIPCDDNRVELVGKGNDLRVLRSCHQFIANIMDLIATIYKEPTKGASDMRVQHEARQCRYRLYRLPDWRLEIEV